MTNPVVMFVLRVQLMMEAGELFFR